MRAAIYARQSKDRAGNELAVARQLEDCRAICSARGWEPIEYLENNTSATTGRRPVYEDMLTDVRAGKIGAVVAWDADRLTRLPRELEDFIDLADAHGLALATVGGDFDLSTPTGRGNARMRGVFARMEMEQKSARQKRQARQQAESGGGWGGRRAYGYTQTDNKIRPDEAKFVRRAYKAVLAGESLYSVAAQMNKDGSRTVMGNDWSGTTLRKMLLNPRYAGKRAYKGDVVADAAWKPIVSGDVWQSVHGILTAEGRRQSRPAGRKYLLSGILQCGVCGDGTTLGSGVGSRGPVYKCRRCQRLSRSYVPVDKLVTGLAVGYMSRPDALKLLVDSEQHDVAALREQESNLLAELERLAADRYDPDVNLTAAQFRAANERLQSKLAEVRASMRDSNRDRVFAGLDTAHALGAVQQWWDGLPLDRQRAIIDTIMAVTLLPMGRGRAFQRNHIRLQWITGDD